jgi:ketosteroid isomerase-like protein
MSSLQQELTELRARLRDLEDRSAITQLIAAYGPAVDSGDAAAAAALWTDDGWYETDPEPLVGAQAVADMVNGPLHQDIIGGGAGHLLGPVAITIDGDSAVAVGYSLLVRYSGDGSFSVFRCSANQWELTRTGAAWKVASRRNALLDGRAQARDLLRPVTRA